MSRRLVVNVHIEKTAGTSLLHFLEVTVGRDQIAFYDPMTDSVIRDSDLLLSPSSRFLDTVSAKTYAFWPPLKKAYFTLEAKKRSMYALPKNIAVVHGHFAADRFDGIAQQPIHTIVIRNPYARMRSQFEHWKKAKGRSQWRIMIPYDKSMTFEEFALLPQLRNYQMQALAKKDLNTFGVVGTTEHIDEFTSALFSLFQKEQHIDGKHVFTKVPRLNNNGKKHEEKSEFEKTFALYHKDDYDLYKQALSMR